MADLIEHVACNLCGGSDFVIDERLTRKVHARQPAKVVVCKICGLGCLNPRFVDELADIYDANYYKEYIKSSQMTGGSDNLEEHLKKRLHKIEKMTRKGRLLEIGSAFGLFLDYARICGWETKGVEVSPWAAEFSRKQYGLDVMNAAFDDVTFSGESLDVVHMNHVLEHMLDPFNVLLKVHGILKKDGLLVFEVPNEFGSMADRLMNLLHLRADVRPYAVPSPHLYFFKPKTIRRLLRKAGFKVLILRTAQRGITYYSRIPGGRYIYWLWYFIQQRLKLGPVYEVFARKE